VGIELELALVYQLQNRDCGKRLGAASELEKRDGPHRLLGGHVSPTVAAGKHQLAVLVEATAAPGILYFWIVSNMIVSRNSKLWPA
jgi:hypothetical protein